MNTKKAIIITKVRNALKDGFVSNDLTGIYKGKKIVMKNRIINAKPIR